MKNILLKTLGANILFFSISFGQNLSPELQNALNRLPPQQRSMVLSEYKKYNQRNLDSSPKINKGNPLPAKDSVPGKSFAEFSVGNYEQTKINLLLALEKTILEDILKNQTELDKLVDETQGALGSEKFILLDRKNDLQKTLREIQKLQLLLISQEVSNAEPSQHAELLLYGYSTFNKLIKTDDSFPMEFKFAGSVIPADYKVGVGDYLEIQLYGRKEAQYSVTIGRNGILQFPGVGPLNVLEQGNSFQSLKNLIKEKVNEQLGEGVRVSISLAELRQIKVFLAGEFSQPGQKIITAGSSLFNLLLDCGGVNEIASLRSLTLKRSGSEDAVFEIVHAGAGESRASQVPRRPGTMRPGCRPISLVKVVSSKFSMVLVS